MQGNDVIFQWMRRFWDGRGVLLQNLSNHVLGGFTKCAASRSVLLRAAKCSIILIWALFWAFLGVLRTGLLPKCPSNLLYYCPCLFEGDYGSCVSGPVLGLLTLLLNFKPRHSRFSTSCCQSGCFFVCINVWINESLCIETKSCTCTLRITLSLILRGLAFVSLVTQKRPSQSISSSIYLSPYRILQY